MAHPNEDLIRNGYEAFARGDVESVMTQLDENIKWHIPGRSGLAGDLQGHEEVMGFFGKLLELSGGTFRLEVHDVVGNDDHVVALIKATAERNGTTREFDNAHIWHVSNGKATEFWGVSTTPYEDDEFWA